MVQAYSNAIVSIYKKNPKIIIWIWMRNEISVQTVAAYYIPIILHTLFSVYQLTEWKCFHKVSVSAVTLFGVIKMLSKYWCRLFALCSCGCARRSFTIYVLHGKRNIRVGFISNLVTRVNITIRQSFVFAMFSFFFFVTFSYFVCCYSSWGGLGAPKWSF